jgi:hypothetical protein
LKEHNDVAPSEFAMDFMLIMHGRKELDRRAFVELIVGIDAALTHDRKATREVKSALKATLTYVKKIYPDVLTWLLEILRLARRGLGWLSMIAYRSSVSYHLLCIARSESGHPTTQHVDVSRIPGDRVHGGDGDSVHVPGQLFSRNHPVISYN